MERQPSASKGLKADIKLEPHVDMLHGGRIEFVGAREPMRQRPFVYIQKGYIEAAEAAAKKDARDRDQHISIDSSHVRRTIVSHILGDVLGSIGGKQGARASDAHDGSLQLPPCVLSSTMGRLPGLHLYNEFASPDLILKHQLGSANTPDNDEDFSARLHVEKAATLVNSITEACSGSSPWFIVPESYSPADRVNWFVTRAAVPNAVILGLGPAFNEFDDNEDEEHRYELIPEAPEPFRKHAHSSAFLRRPTCLCQ